MYSSEYYEILAGMIFVLIFIGLIALVVGILYLLTLQNVLKRVRPENRSVDPSNVWLMLIPLFNLIYAFILYPKISESIAREYAAREMSPDGDFGKTLGTVMPILSLCGFIPILGSFAGLANLVIWIIYWSKMGGYKNSLA